jgi:NADH-ubiquinone/plastoquinone oxidoreductase chain 4L
LQACPQAAPERNHHDGLARPVLDCRGYSVHARRCRGNLEPQEHHRGLDVGRADLAFGQPQSRCLFGDLTGQIFALFILTVAAAEAAIGLAILVAYYRNRGSIAVDDINMMKG